MPPNTGTSIQFDSAGQTLNGQTVYDEPTGPNTPLATDTSGNQLYPGPGYNAFVDRPANCVAQTVPAHPAGTCLPGGGSPAPSARTDTASAAMGAGTIADNAAVVTDPGRSVTGTGIPAGAVVGPVTDTPVTPSAPPPVGIADTGKFALVDASGNPVTTTGPVTSVVLGARTPADDPLYDAGAATTGGGNTGSVLISPQRADRLAHRQRPAAMESSRQPPDGFLGLRGRGRLNSTGPPHQAVAAIRPRSASLPVSAASPPAFRSGVTLRPTRRCSEICCVR